MIGSIIELLAGIASLANKAADYFRKKDDQDTGRKLERADDAEKVIEVGNAVNKADASTSDDELRARLLREARPDGPS